MLLALILLALSFLLILVGVILMFLSTLRKSLKEREEGEGGVRGGAVVVIGPLPIVIGTDREVTKALMILAIALTVVAITLFIVLNLGFLRVAGKPPALSAVDLKQI
uniref:DUF131 domain-containing protein n=1 Tax=Ignisphaera aggregans TaxID=334771 RepID=A0A7J3Z921_9CREN